MWFCIRTEWKEEETRQKGKTETDGKRKLREEKDRMWTGGVSGKADRNMFDYRFLLKLKSVNSILARSGDILQNPALCCLVS